jgi:anti-sigma regulatory factor (Ser/Thr protein kinase)
MQTSPGRARRLARECLAGWGIGGDPADAVELIVSELITNAVMHTRTAHVWLCLALSGTTIGIEVGDGGLDGQRTLEAGVAENLEGESGRGLFLVAHAAASWGSRKGRAGRVVWAHVDAPGAMA